MNKSFLVSLYTLLVSLMFVSTKSGAENQVSDTQQLKSAISLRQDNQHHQAVGILEDLLKNHSDHKRINIELAINYIKLDDFTRSKEILSHLDTLDLSEKERKKLEDLMTLVKNKQKKISSQHQFALNSSLSYGVDKYTAKFPIYEYYDFLDDGDYNNIEYTEDEFSEQAPDERNEETEVTQQHKEQYFAQELKGSYRYRPARKQTLFSQETQLIFTSIGSFYQRQLHKTDNFNKSPNYQQAKIETNLALLTKKQWLFNVKYRGRFHFREKDRVLSDHSFSLSSSFPLTYGRLGFSIEHRKKQFDTNYRQNNATINSPAINYSYRINNAFKWQLGARYRIFQAVNTYNTYRNVNIYSSLYYTHSDNLSAVVSYNRSDVAYTIDDPLLVNWGSELKNSWLSGVKYKFNKHFNIGLNFHHIENTLDRDAGDNQWKRTEMVINYRF